jgi:hypothetical protein
MLSPSARLASLPALLLPWLLLGCDWGSTPSPPKPIVTQGCLADCAYEPARRLVSLYCADCHAQAGNNESHSDAWGYAIRLDTYAEWAKGSEKLIERLDPALAAIQDPPVDPMPSTGFPYQPSQAERDTLLAWLKRGSPNTADGLPDSTAP